MRQKAEKYADVHRAVSCVDKPWSERKQSTPGYMTVYLALVMGILLSLILTVLTAVRISTIRMYIECCADMALDSALAEYHREMLDQYDLFFYRYGVSDRRSILSSDGRTYFPLYGAESASTGGISNSRGKKTCWGFRQKLWSFCRRALQLTMAGRCCSIISSSI